MMRSDLIVHAAVSAALRQDLGPIASEVIVRVRDGVVTLAGTVESIDQKHIAERSVQRVAGVRAVAEELHVSGAHDVPPDDVTLAKAVADSLEIEGPTPGRDITVRVEHGWVSLSGQVTSTADYSAIERALEIVWGVRGVTSEVDIADAGKPPTVAKATH
jgi:osmotically-inducible protein OsmY